MHNHIILVENISSMDNLFQDLEFEDVCIISRTPVRITSKGPVKITAEPRVAPLIITAPEPIPYSYNKAIPWNYKADVYYHGVKQEPLVVKSEDTRVTDPNVDNIFKSSKVTRSGRVFSLEISPKTIATLVRVTSTESTPETRGKEQMTYSAQTVAPKEVTVEDASK